MRWPKRYDLTHATVRKSRGICRAPLAGSRAVLLDRLSERESMLVVEFGALREE